MTWTQLSGADPRIRVLATGFIQWNAATNAMLNNPIAVEMFYDSDRGRLGFRGVNWAAPLRVQFNSDVLIYTIAAAHHLGDAGLSFDQDWNAIPQPPEVLPAPDPPSDPDYRNIVWIAIPE